MRLEEGRAVEAIGVCPAGLKCFALQWLAAEWAAPASPVLPATLMLSEMIMVAPGPLTPPQYLSQAVGPQEDHTLASALAAKPAVLPVCAARLAGALATGLAHTHSQLPSWVDSQEPPPPALGLLLLEGLLRWATMRPHCGNLLLGNGAQRFGPEMGQNERLSEEREGGKRHESKGKSGAPSCHLTHWVLEGTGGT
ncbi:PREDICTED: LOW QUALITY PROTEIN: uncharacterized protein C9orf139 homolog [Galeopterus variegatus]|uniref:LOW QUALITY PROTEIN: uncharacterized protein C9orf139 homolog n=1 Tax=Galeopterus variegatus TaxID=482537 RepID=A0ABM0R292_GALVR|nr:PREDICTED: LOW QUALITY PROTEIN: uncharacterized protein C9orf139 homolog [Galeopterus variegatus]